MPSKQLKWDLDEEFRSTAAYAFLGKNVSWLCFPFVAKIEANANLLFCRGRV